MHGRPCEPVWRRQVPGLVRLGVSCVTLDGSLAQPGSLEVSLAGRRGGVYVSASPRPAREACCKFTRYYRLRCEQRLQGGLPSVQGGWRAGGAAGGRSAAAIKLSRDEAAARMAVARRDLVRGAVPDEPAYRNILGTFTSTNEYR